MGSGQAISRRCSLERAFADHARVRASTRPTWLWRSIKSRPTGPLGRPRWTAPPTAPSPWASSRSCSRRSSRSPEIRSDRALWKIEPHCLCSIHHRQQYVLGWKPLSVMWWSRGAARASLGKDRSRGTRKVLRQLRGSVSIPQSKLCPAYRIDPHECSPNRLPVPQRS